MVAVIVMVRAGEVEKEKQLFRPVRITEKEVTEMGKKMVTIRVLVKLVTRNLM